MENFETRKYFELVYIPNIGSVALIVSIYLVYISLNNIISFKIWVFGLKRPEIQNLHNISGCIEFY